jgi:type II secretory pathway component GspD/PulD (secretin)
MRRKPVAKCLLPADAKAGKRNSMKSLLTVCLLVAGLILSGCSTPPPPAKTYKQTYSSFDLVSDHPVSEVMPPGTINFDGARVDTILEIYGKLSDRTVLHGSLPSVDITLRVASSASRIELLRMLDTVLAKNGIAMLYSGDKVVRAVPVNELVGEDFPEINLPWQLLPESSSPMMRKVYLKKLKPSECVPLLKGLSGLPNGIVAVDSQKLLILRDYSANVRQELKFIEELERK